MTSRKTKRNVKGRVKKEGKKTKQETKVIYVEKPMGIGAQIGDSLQKFGTSLFTKFMGTGDYVCNDLCQNIKSNSMMRGSEAKAVKMTSDRSTYVFEHSEFVTDIISSGTIGAFNVNTFTMNPANAALFPFLSQFSYNFEAYELEGLLFRYVSTSGESVAGTNTAIGSVMANFEYDSLDANFVSKQQMLQYDDTVDCRTSENLIVGVECDKSRLPTFTNKLYVGTPPAGSDPKTYNFGNFAIATQGLQAANVTVGELWVNYRIKFHIAKQSLQLPSTYKISTSSATAGGNYTGQQIHTGNLQVVNNGNNIVINNAIVGAKYQFTFNCYCGTSGSWSYAPSSFFGTDGVNLLENESQSVVAAGNASNNFIIVATQIALQTTIGVNDIITAAPAEPFSVDVLINQLDVNVY
jgi:hypothetical protein